MQVESLVAAQPALHVGMVVGGVVVQDQMYRKVFGHFAIDRAEELQELLVPVPGQALPDHRPGEHVDRGEQRGGAVAFVVVGHGARAALLHRQRRLSAVQRLHL